MYIKIIIGIIFICNILDYFFTNKAIAMGAKEINPIMDMTIGTPFFPLIKLGLIPLFILIVFFTYNHWKNSRVVWYFVWIMFGVYFGTTVWHGVWQAIL